MIGVLPSGGSHWKVRTRGPSTVIVKLSGGPSGAEAAWVSSHAWRSTSNLLNSRARCVRPAGPIVTLLLVRMYGCFKLELVCSPPRCERKSSDASTIDSRGTDLLA